MRHDGGMIEDRPDAERRREPRFRVQKPCLFMFEGSTRFEQCLALEQSASGVRVLCSPAFQMPGSGVSLIFISERLLQPVDVIWRKGSYIGLAFAGEAYHLPEEQSLEATQNCPFPA